MGMATQYEKNKEFLLSDDCCPSTPMAATFAKNKRLFMLEQDDFTEKDRAKYHDKLQRDIDLAKKKITD